MSVIIGIIVPAILFLITLPLQSFLFVARQSLKLEEIKLKKRSKGSLKKNLGFSGGTDALRSRLGLSPSKSKKQPKNTKLRQLSLKAMQALIKALSELITLLRSVASSLIITVLTSFTILVPICLAVIIAATSIVMFANSDGSTITYGEAVANTNIVDSNVNSSGWVGSIETMAKWYLKNVSTYQTSPEGTYTGKRGWYACDLVDGKNVGDDCTGFSYACLVYAGYIADSPANAPGSSSYISGGSMVSKLQEAGFTHSAVSSDTVFQAGDILAKSGHVELVVGVNEDGTYQTFGWGKIQSSYPSTSSISGASLIKDYSDYYRLSK